MLFDAVLFRTAGRSLGRFPVDEGNLDQVPFPFDLEPVKFHATMGQSRVDYQEVLARSRFADQGIDAFDWGQRFDNVGRLWRWFRGQRLTLRYLLLAATAGDSEEQRYQ
jgi:hypothetical protein